MRFLVLFALLLVAAHLGLAQSDVKYPNSTLVLTPHLPRNAVVQSVKLQDGHVQLAFSAHSAGGGEQQAGVLRVNQDGSLRDVVPVPPGSIRNIFFDDLGRLNAARERGASTELATYDSRGRPVPATAAHCSSLKGAGDLSQDVYIAALDERTLAFVSKRAPKVAIVDCGSGRSTSITLKHPLMDESVARHASMVRNSPQRAAGALSVPLLFVDAGGDGKGNLLVAVGSYVAPAVPLIFFDRNGKHLRTVHLNPPSLDARKTATNPEGLVVPRWFSVDNDTVAIASTDGVVSLYTIE